jgi:hypothetical protein
MLKKMVYTVTNLKGLLKELTQGHVTRENEKWVTDFNRSTSSEVTTGQWQDNIKVNGRGNEWVLIEFNWFRTSFNDGLL